MNTLTIKARSVARRVGLTRLFHRVFPQRNYEQNFHDAIFEELRSGDIVWDVGANVGLYTKMFAEKTGVTGRVFAFEPAPEAFGDLCKQTKEYSWVRNEQMALSNFDGISRLVVFDAAARSTCHHLQWDRGDPDGARAIEIPVMCGDSYISASGITPGLLKIDVEGFEEEVLDGMSGLLAAPELRAVFVEVHFQILESRGRAQAPVRIEKLLRSRGLLPRWVDSSHISAKRGASKSHA
jgi:FkbM family methyltransferase